MYFTSAWKTISTSFLLIKLHSDFPIYIFPFLRSHLSERSFSWTCPSVSSPLWPPPSTSGSKASGDPRQAGHHGDDDWATWAQYHSRGGNSSQHQPGHRSVQPEKRMINRPFSSHAQTRQWAMERNISWLDCFLFPGPEDPVNVPSHIVDWDRQEESESSVASSGTSSRRSSQLIWRERLLMGAGTSPESSESGMCRAGEERWRIQMGGKWRVFDLENEGISTWWNIFLFLSRFSPEDNLTAFLWLWERSRLLWSCYHKLQIPHWGNQASRRCTTLSFP